MTDSGLKLWRNVTRKSSKIAWRFLEDKLTSRQVNELYAL